MKTIKIKITKVTKAKEVERRKYEWKRTSENRNKSVLEHNKLCDQMKDKEIKISLSKYYSKNFICISQHYYAGASSKKGAPLHYNTMINFSGEVFFQKNYYGRNPFSVIINENNII